MVWIWVWLSYANDDSFYRRKPCSTTGRRSSTTALRSPRLFTLNLSMATLRTTVLVMSKFRDSNRLEGLPDEDRIIPMIRLSDLVRCDQIRWKSLWIKEMKRCIHEQISVCYYTPYIRACMKESILSSLSSCAGWTSLSIKVY